MTDADKCMRCGALGSDRRTLWMACFYAMGELGVPFEERGVHGVNLLPKGTNAWGGPEWEDHEFLPDERNVERTYPFFTLRVCKGCRSEWMTAIQAWFRAPPGDVVRWNNDASSEPAPMAELVAALEKLRIEAESLQQRINDSVSDARRELERRSGLVGTGEAGR